MNILERIAYRLMHELKKAAPSKTANLRRSIKVFPYGDGLRITMTHYGKYVEFGTPPHVIKPKNKKALAFAPFGATRVQHDSGNVSAKFKFGGKTTKVNAVFAKVVHHPGTRPNPFVRNTIMTKLPKIIREEIAR